MNPAMPEQMTLLEKAIGIALHAHAGQKSKDGSPYILHPLRVMGRMQTDEEKMAAILHDVVVSEGLKESFYIEDLQQTYLHLLVFDTLLEGALDAEASRELIIQTAEDYWRGSP